MLLLEIPTWLTTTFWGLVSGSALLIGSFIGYYRKVSSKVTGIIMGFGSGILISALSFELMEEAYNSGGFNATVIGFLLGAFIYSFANYLLSRKGAKHRKRSGIQQATEKNTPGSGTAIAIGALIDGIPESIALGVTMIHGNSISIATLVAIFLSNIPESLSSTSGMKKAGRSALYIFSIWGGIMLLSGLAAYAGYAIFSHFSPQVTAGIIAIAAGGILAMISSTMIPEAYEETHDIMGIVTVFGFLASFLLSKMQ